MNIPPETFSANDSARRAPAPLYRDARGYIWQRMRNGTWRSTDGMTTHPTQHAPGSADPPTRLPQSCAPYTRIFEVPPMPTPTAANAWDDSAEKMLEAAWGLIANVWDCAGREKFVEWMEAAACWRDHYHHRLDEPPAELTPG